MSQNKPLGVDLVVAQFLPFDLAQSTHAIVNVISFLHCAPLPYHVDHGFSHDDFAVKAHRHCGPNSGVRADAAPEDLALLDERVLERQRDDFEGIDSVSDVG